MFSVGDVVEYSDLSPWEPCIIRASNSDEIRIEFLDGNIMNVLPSEVRALTWDTVKEIDENRERLVREIGQLRQDLYHAEKIANTLP